MAALALGTPRDVVARLERLVELGRGGAEGGVHLVDAAEPARVVEQRLQRLEDEALHLPQLHLLGDAYASEDQPPASPRHEAS